MKNKDQLNVGAKLKALAPGMPFFVQTEYQRQQVIRVAKALKQCGAIEFDVVTKKEGNQFKVAAI